MKKSAILFLLIIFVISVTFFSLPYMGINVSIAELLGRTVPLLKAEIPKNLHPQSALKLEKYIQGLDTPRFMYITNEGDLLVAEPNEGEILFIPYNLPKQQQTLVDGLIKPHSMDVHQGYLYVAEENAIGRIKFNAQSKSTEGAYERIIKNLPDDGGHWTRTIKFGPDGFAYVSIGSSCNACLEKNPLRATISRFKPGDKQLTIYAKGLRNSVGFDWSPENGQLYATDNGRDWLGDHFPPDELNIIEKDQFYGWPYANGDRVPDPKFGKGHEDLIQKSLPPVFKFDAHVAPLGITFIKNPKSRFYNKALVALHGSWNSSVKVGYKVVVLDFTNGHIKEEDFITGFLQNGKVRGRPVHLVEGKNNEIYLSDDYNGVIYRILPQQ
ncbi:PQQ-dependent sugar dehydrogenase [Legionella israelensis]|uniref:L-sorbosone dehydrogenase n=1 Tax=Legionella israelensis TaxID=454 RepID=A0A0W0WG73_9GAMM|nr:PQQ-dependent sugar dehydrogenase [Legionella israelensis]KTD31330.1 L-sorbosone dehydrogenase [Legionella israelensis]QBS09709.1 sorbosone dehydrogenase family protein [Legionella israelensis]SCY15020.1 Glucose/arabinose dehydrogenase, beta-propeller fold [Legionella israelensis DSM 19235]STX59238.1 L-sorbosone dehydrogenase [Legionella israelensis]